MRQPKNAKQLSRDQFNVCSVTRVFLMTSEGIRSCEVRIDNVEIRVTRYQKLAAKYFGRSPAHITTSHR